MTLYDLLPWSETPVISYYSGLVQSHRSHQISRRHIYMLSSLLLVLLRGFVWSDFLNNILQTFHISEEFLFWVIRPHSLLKVNRRSGGTRHFHLNGRRMSRAKNECHLLSHWFLAHLILRAWRWRRRFLPKRWLTFQRTTLRYISEGITFHNHRCENLRFYIYHLPLRTNSRPTHSPLFNHTNNIDLFMMYLTTLSLSQITWRRMVGWLVNKELEKI
jgi:hypothetical protein